MLLTACYHITDWRTQFVPVRGIEGIPPRDHWINSSEGTPKSSEGDMSPRPPVKYHPVCTSHLKSVIVCGSGAEQDLLRAHFSPWRATEVLLWIVYGSISATSAYRALSSVPFRIGIAWDKICCCLSWWQQTNNILLGGCLSPGPMGGNEALHLFLRGSSWNHYQTARRLASPAYKSHRSSPDTDTLCRPHWY